MTALDLSGKRAIVTGASSGIGKATAAALAVAGVRVAGGARRVERLETEVALELDVTDAASCSRFVGEAVEHLGGLDILVNNAGLALGRAPFDESSEEDEAAVFAVNVTGLVETNFSLVRFKGDEEKAAAVYQGVEAMQPEDIAECILFALTRPWHVNVDEIVVKARTQSSGGRILRDE